MTVQHYGAHGRCGREFPALKIGQAATRVTRGVPSSASVALTTEMAHFIWRAFALVAEFIRRNPEVGLSVDETIDLVKRVVTEWPLRRLMSDTYEG